MPHFPENSRRRTSPMDAAAKSLLFQIEYREALERLQTLDPSGWESWYDGRPEQTCGEMLPLIKNRIHELSVTRITPAS